MAKKVPKDVVKSWIYSFWPKIESYIFRDENDIVDWSIYWESDTHCCSLQYDRPQNWFIYRVFKWHTDPNFTTKDLINEEDFIELANKVPRDIVQSWIYAEYNDITEFVFNDEDYSSTVLMWRLNDEYQYHAEWYFDPSTWFTYRVMMWNFKNGK